MTNGNDQQSTLRFEGSHDDNKGALNHGRRAVLKGIAGSTIIAAGLGQFPDRVGAQQVGEVEGRVVGPNNRPVPQATMWAFDARTFDFINMTKTGDDGRFTINASAQAVKFIAEAFRPPLDGQNRWFGYSVVGNPSGDIGDIPIRFEMMFGPETVEADNLFGPSQLGAVSLWRWLPGDPPYFEQVFFMEILNISNDDDEGLWEIHDDWLINFPDLSSGIFTLSFPEEDIMVNYGSQSPDIDLELVEGGIVIQGADTPTSDTSALVKFHPLRWDTPDLPIFEMINRTSANPWVILTRSDAEKNELIGEGVGHILGLMPHIGTFTGVRDVLNWGFGNLLDVRGSVGDAEDELPVLDPNKTDSVVQAWESDNGSFSEREAAVVFSVPLRFETDEELETDFIAQAEWQVGRGSTDASWTGAFRKKFSAGPEVTFRVPFEVSQFDRDDDGKIDFDDLRFASGALNEGAITFDQFRQILSAHNTGRTV